MKNEATNDLDVVSVQPNADVTVRRGRHEGTRDALGRGAGAGGLGRNCEACRASGDAAGEAPTAHRNRRNKRGHCEDEGE